MKSGQCSKAEPHVAHVWEEDTGFGLAWEFVECDGIPEPVPGAFFPITGKFDELVRIRAGVEATCDRLTASDSASCDLWLEMEDEWFKLHRKEVLANVQAFQDMAAAIVKALDGVGPALIQMAETWAEVLKPDTVTPPSQTSWDTKQTHPDCVHCEAAVEMAIQSCIENGLPDQTWTVHTPQPDCPNGVHTIEHKGTAKRA